MIQEFSIDEETMKYLEFLNMKYREVVHFLGEKDGSLDLVKVQLFFERIVSHFAPDVTSLNEVNIEKKVDAREMAPDERKSFLDALVRNKKYSLQKMGDGYIVRANLADDRMKELVEKMGQAGFKYETGKGFVEVGIDE